MNDFRPFSTPSPLLEFPSASPTSKLRCTPTRKPPTPIDWTKECHQVMALEANQHHHHSNHVPTLMYTSLPPDYDRDPLMAMATHLRRHSTPDFFATFATEEEELIDRLYDGIDLIEDADDDMMIASMVREMRLDAVAVSPSPPLFIQRPHAPMKKKQSPVPPSQPAPEMPSYPKLNLSSCSSYSSSSSILSSVSGEDRDTNERGYTPFDIHTQYNLPPVVLERREQRRQTILQQHRQTYGVSTSSSWLSTVPSEATTLRERHYQQRLLQRKKSKFGLFIDRMKRAAERPFRMI
ncbi:hypothetical protein DM01DRAFT_1333538, partial [Hesseltinella vesiculosa]